MKLLVVDGNSILNRAYYGIKLLTTKDGVYTNAVYGFMNILGKVCDDIAPDCVAVAFDLPQPTFRHEMYKDYKAGRKPSPDELRAQFPIIKELLGDLGYTIVEKAGFEADDILGTLGAACEKSGDQCFIVTGDRDSLQLVSQNVTVRLAATKMGKPETVIYDTDKISEVYGIAPKQLIDVKSLMGDSSDNIPGVAGIGEKTALSLIQAYGSLDAILSQVETIDIKEGVRQKLIAGADSAKMSYTLATINCAVPIDTVVASYKLGEIDKPKAAALLNKLEMFSLLKKLGLTGVQPAAPANASSPAAPRENISITFSAGFEDFQSLVAEADELCFLCEYDGEDITALYLAANGRAMAVSAEDEWFGKGLSLVLSCGKKKITHDVKSVYRWGLAHDIEVTGIICDTMLAAYLINPLASGYELDRLCGEYGIQAPDIGLLSEFAGIAALYPLYKKLWSIIVEYAQVQLYNDIELPLARVLASMEHIGFVVDTDGIRQFGSMLDSDISRLGVNIFKLADTQFNINSPKQLGEVLFVKLGLPTGKKTKSGYSTGAEVLEGLRGTHPIIEDILEYRKLTKLKSTYVEGLLKVARDDGTIHTRFNQTETRTGRISSLEPNLQNIPVRTKLGSELRKFFVAPSGCVLIDADYSQIELRVLAHIADDKNMINVFLEGGDIHRDTAAQIFDMPPQMVTPLLRSRAKAVNFGIVYGIGAYSLSQDIGVTVAEADKYIKSYLSTYSGVKEYMENSIEFAKEHGFAKTMYNRRRGLPELTASNRNIKSFGERVAMNAPIQGTAADIIKIAMIRVYDRLKREGLSAQLILQVHDELIVQAPLAEAERAGQIVHEEMENAAQLKVPLLADYHIGDNWYTAKG